MDDMKETRNYLKSDLEAKWGFVIYRTTYQDDSQWKRFMGHLNTRVRLELEVRGDGELFSRIDWCVQEDAELQDASVADVRRYSPHKSH